MSKIKKITNLLLVILIVLQTLNVSAVNANFMKPINQIELFSSNAANRLLAVENEFIYLKMEVNDRYLVENIYLNDKNVPFQFRCISGSCVYSLQYKVAANTTKGKLNLKADLREKSSEILRKITFVNTPLYLMEITKVMTPGTMDDKKPADDKKPVVDDKKPADDKKPVVDGKKPADDKKPVVDNIVTVSSLVVNSTKGNTITTGDKFTVSFTSSNLAAKNEVDLLVAGKSFKLNDLKKSNQSQDMYLYTVEVTADDSFKEGNIPVILSFKTNNKQVTVNQTTDNSKLSYKKPEPKPPVTSDNDDTFTDSVQISTTNSLNNQLITDDDELQVQFKTNRKFKVNGLDVGNDSFLDKLKTTCQGNSFCNHIFKIENQNLISDDPKVLNITLDYEDLNKPVKNDSEKVFVNADYRIKHLGDRITFGMNSDNREFISKNGLNAFLNQQLNPQSINNTSFESNIPYQGTKIDHEEKLNKLWLYHMLNSNKQLQERMTWFWQNHFNTLSAKFKNVGWKSSSFGNIDEKGVHITRRSQDKDDSAYNEQLDKLKVNLANYDKMRILIENDKKDLNRDYNTQIKFTTVGDDTELANSNKVVNIYTKDNQLSEKSFKSSGTLASLRVQPEFIDNDRTKSRYRIKHLSLVDSSNRNPEIDLISNGYQLHEDDHQFYRANALGNFTDMVQATSKMPHMLYYLDNYTSTKDKLNENYAREVMELHVLGVNGGYDETDIQKVAKILSGWTIRGAEFAFVAEDHDSSPQKLSFMSSEIPAGGIKQGEEFLKRISQSNSAAEFMCTKLQVHFVNDQIDSNIQKDCVNTFLANVNSKDQIKKVLQSMFTNQNFYAAKNYRSKMATPHLYATQMVRKLDYIENDMNSKLFNRIYEYLKNQTHVFGKSARPTGFEEESVDWFNPYQYLNRIRINRSISFYASENTNLVNTLSKNGELDTVDELIHSILNMAVGDDYGKQEFDFIKNEVLRTTYFDIDDTAKEFRLRDAFSYAMLLPAAQQI